MVGHFQQTKLQYPGNFVSILDLLLLNIHTYGQMALEQYMVSADKHNDPMFSSGKLRNDFNIFFCLHLPHCFVFKSFPVMLLFYYDARESLLILIAIYLILLVPVCISLSTFSIA